MLLFSISSTIFSLLEAYLACSPSSAMSQSICKHVIPELKLGRSLSDIWRRRSRKLPFLLHPRIQASRGCRSELDDLSDDVLSLEDTSEAALVGSSRRPVSPRAHRRRACCPDSPHRVPYLDALVNPSEWKHITARLCLGRCSCRVRFFLVVQQTNHKGPSLALFRRRLTAASPSSRSHSRRWSVTPRRGIALLDWLLNKATPMDGIGYGTPPQLQHPEKVLSEIRS